MLRIIVLSFVLLVFAVVVGGVLDSKPVSYDPDIECDIAELIWWYAKKLLPSQGDFKSVYDAVNLRSCYKNADQVFPSNLKKRSPVDNEVYVDPGNGSDSNPGIESKPVKTIEKALTLLRTIPKGQAKTMYLKSAYYYLASTIELGPEDSGLSILPWDSIKKDEVKKKRSSVLVTDIEIYVDPEHGKDSNSGTQSHPVKTIDKALYVLRAAPMGQTKAMYLKGATYYLDSTIELGPEDSGLTISPWGEDEVVLSGGKLYKLPWTEYKNKMKPIERGLDGIADLELEPGASRKEALFYGKVLSVEECSTACVRNTQCNGFTYYDASSHTHPMMCYLRIDGRWNPVRDVSGSSFSSQKIHIVVADLSDQSPTDFTSLFINNRRAVRARYPDGNPETSGLHTDPTGYVPNAERWLPPATKEPGEEILITSPNRTGTYFPFFQVGVGGSVSVFTPPQSYWGTANPSGGDGATYRIPTGLQFFSNLSIANRTWSNPSTGIVHAFHCQYWGGWQFKLDARDDVINHTLKWSHGGFQEARGCDAGHEWYVENIFEELDSPGEWFLDYDTHKLYLSPNGTLPTEAVGTNLEVILSFKGSQSHPVKNIAINDITFAHSATTFLSDYEVPSAGDWTVHRGAAVVVEGAENVNISNCLFYSPGGNGLLLSNYIRGAVIEGNEFVWVGDNAIVAVGSTQLIDGTDGNQPRGTKVIGNLVHEVGVFGKQVCAYVQSLACETELIGNVFFNGPRAGVNFNDGFGGGNLFKNNLLFNFVRETLDHGAFNSWDRQPYVSTVNGKTPSINAAESFLTQNLVVGNYRSLWPIDHDDGSCFFTDKGNVVVYGGAKYYLGHSKISSNNLYIYPNVERNGFETLNPSCASSFTTSRILPKPSGYDEVWSDNVCVTGIPSVFQFNECSLTDNAGLVPMSANNIFYAPNAIVYIKCDGVNLTLEEYQEMGFEVDSVVMDLPSNQEVMKWARQKLEF